MIDDVNHNVIGCLFWTSKQVSCYRLNLEKFSNWSHYSAVDFLILIGQKVRSAGGNASHRFVVRGAYWVKLKE